jgi:hypothetical protein
MFFGFCFCFGFPEGGRGGCGLCVLPWIDSSIDLSVYPFCDVTIPWRGINRSVVLPYLI